VSSRLRVLQVFLIAVVLRVKVSPITHRVTLLVPPPPRTIVTVTVLTRGSVFPRCLPVPKSPRMCRTSRLQAPHRLPTFRPSLLPKVPPLDRPLLPPEARPLDRPVFQVLSRRLDLRRLRVVVRTKRTAFSPSLRVRRAPSSRRNQSPLFHARTRLLLLR
jgi:hypothetical protein